MKKLLCSIIFISAFANAQVGIGVAVPNINASAQLDVTSTTRGLLPPRMTSAQRTAIASPAAGLMVWCSNCGANGELEVYNGTSWTNLVGGTAQLPVVSIGDSYQGGKVFYILQPGDAGYNASVQHGLIAATSNQTFSNIIWSTSTLQCFGASDVLSNCQVTSIYNNASVAASRIAATAIGMGAANTAAIIAVNTNGGQALTSYAAGLCRNYSVTVGGVTYSDWYLPSSGELYQLWVNRGSVGMTNNWFWSSTEGNDNKASMQNFSNSSAQVIIDDKSHANVQQVRAIRSF